MVRLGLARRAQLALLGVALAASAAHAETRAFGVANYAVPDGWSVKAAVTRHIHADPATGA